MKIHRFIRVVALVVMVVGVVWGTLLREMSPTQAQEGSNTLQATPEYRVPCNVTNAGNSNWMQVRNARGFTTDQQLLDDMNNWGRLQSHWYSEWGQGAIDLNNRPANIGGSRDHPSYGVCDDLTVRAGRDGKVTFWSADRGTLYIDHGDGYVSHYAHMASKAVNVNDHVSEGQVIGTMGSASADNVHLHFDVWTGGNRTTNWLFKDPFRPDDTIPPTGGLTEPPDGTVAQQSITIKGDANDDSSGVDYVQFTAHYDGAWHLVFKDTEAPYEYTWDMSGVADQTITLGFDVIDKAGNAAYSPGGVRNIVKDTVTPTGRLTEPPDGTVAQQSITIKGDANDDSSGVDYVLFRAYYDGEWHTISQSSTPPFEYTWDMSGVTDQIIGLGFDIFDKAGNAAYSPGGVRNITKDSTAPTFPETVTSEGSEDDTWQNGVAQPTFTWSEAQDAVAGVEGYLIYWGTDPDGTSDVLQTDTTFDAPEPVADGDGAATYYLRMATRDTFGNTSAWQTIYTFRYDNSKPAGTAELNHGWGIAHSVAMPIALFPEDNGSGTTNVRLSNDGTTWSDWFPMQDVVWWQVDRSHGDTAPVAVQYRDSAGNESDAITQSLALDFYPPLPSSAHYRIQADVVGTGGGSSTSANYVVNATAGQVLASGDYASSSNYRASLGYWSQMNAAVSGDTKVYLPLVLLR